MHHSTDTLLTLRDVNKAYTEADTQRSILVNVNLRVLAGERLALVGRSGSGKSTLLNLISGIDLPSSGEIVLNGHRLHALSESERTLVRRREIGFIFQAFNLIPTLTVEENIRLPLELNGLNDTTPVLELLNQLELSHRAHAYPDRLSGGEQQRVAIARALAHDPALILADEPTGNLDTETGSLVLTLLDSMTQTRGKTLILATHSREVMAMADRILTVGQGRLTPLPSERE